MTTVTLTIDNCHFDDWLITTDNYHIDYWQLLLWLKYLNCLFDYEQLLLWLSTTYNLDYGQLSLWLLKTVTVTIDNCLFDYRQLSLWILTTVSLAIDNFEYNCPFDDWLITTDNYHIDMDFDY